MIRFCTQHQRREALLFSTALLTVIASAGMPSGRANAQDLDVTAADYTVSGTIETYDDITVDNGFTLSVDASGMLTSNAFTFIGETVAGTAVISGAGSALHVGFTLSLGENAGATGTMTVEDGATATTGSTFVGYSGTGDLTVSGTNSVLQTAGDLAVASQSGSTGTMMVEDGATATTEYAYVGLSGAGELTVSGTNSVLQASEDIVVAFQPGSAGTMTVENGATATAASRSYVGLSGNGELTVSGAGSALQGGNLLYIGFSSGTTGTMMVEDGATATATTAYVGDQGTGELTVSGTNSALQVGNTLYMGFSLGSSGTVTVEDGASATIRNLQVGFRDTGELTVSGAGSALQVDNTVFLGAQATGAGTLTVEDGAILTTRGVFAGSGNATFTVNGGTLRANQNNAGFVNGFTGSDEFSVGANGMTLDTNGFNVGIIAPIDWSSGAGLITLGTGEVSFANALTIAYGQFDSSVVATSGTSVEGGTLIIGSTAGSSAVLTSDVVLQSGSTLGGHGTINGNVSNIGGTIAPGNSIGTTTITGDYSGTGTLLIEVDGDVSGPPSADQLVVGGLVDISGTALDLVLSPSNSSSWSTGTTGPFIIIDNQGGSAVTGTFTSVTDNLVFIDAAVAYDAGTGNDVELTLMRNDIEFTQYALTPNQFATAEAAESLGPGNPVYDAIAGLSSGAEARASFDLLSGEFNASARTAFLDDSRIIRDAIGQRLFAAAHQEGAAPAQDTASVLDGLILWMQGIGNWSQANGRYVSKMDRSVGGLLVGADKDVWESGRLGLLAGFSQTTMDVDRLRSSGTSSNASIAGYGNASWVGFSVRGGVAATWHQLDSTRTAAVGTTLVNELSADQTAFTSQAFGELAYSQNWSGVTVEPFAGLAQVSVYSRSFTETGGPSALHAVAQSNSALFTTLGVRSSAGFQLAGRSLRAYGALGWQNTTNTDVYFTQSFATGGNPFLISGIPLAKNVGVIEAGGDMALGESATVGLAYFGQLSQDINTHGVRALMIFRF